MLAQARGAAEDQALLGARHRHVHHAPLLGLVGRRRSASIASKSSAVTLRAVDADEAQADALAADEEVRRAEVAPAAEVGDDHDRELEALGGVDRHQPHGVEAAEVDRRVGLARLGLELGGGQVDEAAHVAPAARLEGGRQPQQLVDVGQAPRAARQREHVQVVAGAAQRALEQLVEPEPRRALALAGEPRAEGGQAPRVLGRRGQRVVVRRASQIVVAPSRAPSASSASASEDRPTSGEASSPSSASSSRGLASAASRWHRSWICWRPHQPPPPAASVGSPASSSARS